VKKNHYRIWPGGKTFVENDEVIKIITPTPNVVPFDQDIDRKPERVDDDLRGEDGAVPAHAFDVVASNFQVRGNGLLISRCPQNDHLRQKLPA
jgi:hypothetical protein